MARHAVKKHTYLCLALYRRLEMLGVLQTAKIFGGLQLLVTYLPHELSIHRKFTHYIVLIFYFRAICLICVATGWLIATLYKVLLAALQASGTLLYSDMTW